jgi:peptidoglycan hydrolase CwlO-like protein|tara:strand:+ start:1001 stop:1387 length:387 start_codon:yes stop_codon:yes gene_type:complete
MPQDKNAQEMVLELYELFSSFKKRIEDPNYIQIENTLTQLVDNQNEMKNEIKSLKKQLLNPFDGVIVENKKNSEFREAQEALMKEREELIEEHKSLVRWKSSISKVGIAVLSSIGVVMTWAISKYFSQ